MVSQRKTWLTLLFVAAIMLAACAAPSNAPGSSAGATAPAGGSQAGAPAPQGTAAQSGAAPTGAAQAGGARIELNFWGGWTGPDRDVMAKMVEEYNNSQAKVHVTLTTQQWSPLFDKFVLSVKSKTPPDLLAMHTQDIAQFASQNVLEQLGDVVSKAGFKEADFAKPVWDGTMYNGKQYAFPLDQHMKAVYYNADMFTKANLTPPTDWINKDDFLKLATGLTVDKNGKHPNDAGFDAQNVQQYGYGFYTNHHGFYEFYGLLYQQGDTFLNKDNTKVAYDPAHGAAAWQWLQDLIYKYHVTPVGQTNPLQDFLSGKTAMLDDGPWQIPALQAQTGFKWGSFPTPQVFANKATWGSGHVLTIPVQADKAREAAAQDLAKWIVQHSDTWATSGQIPALNSARESQQFTSLPGRDGFIKSLPYEVTLPDINATAQAFSSAATSPIVVASQQILVEDKPVEPAMKSMNQSVESILASQ